MQVWKISVQGSSYLSLLMVGAGLLWGKVFKLHPIQTVFISSCLSLSSTPLVSRFLSGGSRGDKEGKSLCVRNRGRNKKGSCIILCLNALCECVCVGELDYSSVLLGMLVMQDVQLSLFIAIMPTLIQAGSGGMDR